ncbi:hypothetical protein SAMN04487983_1001126 [Streptomyces sp. yr375]|uniref:hypothetical protein n=1 Tax=Streptomyces sp. yr375 TaxID=1761906 RepID=UPI0008C55A8D|nr:hypothetical protein [Streptomyces sp. yr375]SEP62122.1 hypothetical protein SAMN04487983_1001126 [Streptomyces sp. yr375]
MRTRYSLTRLALTATATGVLALSAPAVALAAAVTGPTAVSLAPSPGPATSVDTSATKSTLVDIPEKSPVTASQWTGVTKLAKQRHALTTLYDQGTKKPVIVLPADAPTTQRVSTLSVGDDAATSAAVSASSVTVSGVKAEVKVSKFTTKRIDQISDTLTARKWSQNAVRYGFAVHYDAKTDKVAFVSDAPQDVTAAAKKTFPADVEVIEGHVQPLQTDRFLDVPAYYSGLSLINTNGGLCTGGPSFWSYPDGAEHHTAKMVTAAHCGSVSSLFHNYKWNRGYVGTVDHRDTGSDTEDLMYSHNIGDGDGACSHGEIRCYSYHMFTGGTSASSSEAAVVGWQEPVVGDTGLHVSGQTSYQWGGNVVTNTNFQTCYKNTDICIRNGGFLMRHYNNGWDNKTAQPGDSGGPIYKDKTDFTGARDAWPVEVMGIISGGYSECDRCSNHPVNYTVGIDIEWVRIASNNYEIMTFQNRNGF